MRSRGSGGLVVGGRGWCFLGAVGRGLCHCMGYLKVASVGRRSVAGDEGVGGVLLGGRTYSLIGSVVI